MCALLFLVSFARADADGSLVSSDDFETVSSDAPPAGWAMWGDDAYKDPKNYQRDTEQAHGGKASLRIAHPANTGGYLVTHPSRAIKSQPNTTYEITFFAKAKAPTRSIFGVSAYQTIDPYLDAPPPGMWPIELGEQWQAYRFRIREGVEFDARVARLLMLTFKATADFKEERTIWIDDVRVTAFPNDPSLPRLVSLQTAPHTPVDHVLKPGKALEVTIDITKPLRPATLKAAGIAFHRVCGHPQVPYHPDGTYTLKKATENQIAELRVPMTRFYGVGDEKLGTNWAIDRVAELCKMAGIAQENCILELEDQYANVNLKPQQWADAVRYSQSKGYKFNHWEVGNEVYASMWGGGKAFPDADQYIDHLKAVSAAVRAVQPDTRVGVSLRHDHMTWGSYVLARAAGSYDFVCPHLYGLDPSNRPFEALTLLQNYRILDEAARLRGMIKAYNPDRPVAILDSEWGAHMSGPNDTAADFQARNANIVGVLHRAIRLIYYVREPLVEGTSAWGLIGRSTEPGFPAIYVDHPEKRSMLFWLHFHLIRHIGKDVVAMNGTAPYFESAGPQTPLVATRSADGKRLHLILANGSWDRPVPMSFQLVGQRFTQVRAIQLTQNQLDSDPVLPDANDPARELPLKLEGATLSGTLPAKSVVFITME